MSSSVEVARTAQSHAHALYESSTYASCEGREPRWTDAHEAFLVAADAWHEANDTERAYRCTGLALYVASLSNGEESR